MAYAVGSHPHVRSAESLAARFWTPVFFLLPGVFIKIFSKSELVFPLLAAAAGIFLIHFLCSALSGLKPDGWKQGVLPLFIFLWFLICPASVIWPGALIFPVVFFLTYESSGRLGAYTLHPVCASLLVTTLWFSKSFSDNAAPSFFVFDVLSLCFLGLCGLYLGLRGFIRVFPAIVFILTSLVIAFMTRVPLDYNFFHTVLFFGIFILSDSSLSPLISRAHVSAALAIGGAAIFLGIFQKNILSGCVLAFSTYGFLAPFLDSFTNHAEYSRLKVNHV